MLNHLFDQSQDYELLKEKLNTLNRLGEIAHNEGKELVTFFDKYANEQTCPPVSFEQVIKMINGDISHK